MYALIFDAKENTVAFYKRTNPSEKSPTDAKEIEKQLTKLFEGYFYERE